jgi:hypothetical protein
MAIGKSGVMHQSMHVAHIAVKTMRYDIEKLRIIVLKIPENRICD